ncbi:MAG TPA: MMPL family transporter [Ktedonobacterales bacterium]
MGTRALHALTNAAASRRGKFVTIALWLVAVALFTVFAPKLADVYDNNTQQIPSSDASQVAQRLLLKEFPASRGAPAIVVFTDAHGLSDADRARARTVSDWLASSAKPSGVGQVVSIFTIPQAAPQLVSKDGTTMTMVVQLTTSPTNGDAISAVVTPMRAQVAAATSGSSLHGYVTGPAGIVADTITVFKGTDVTLLLATVGLVLVLLLLVYRSPLLPLLPIVAVGLVTQVADALLALAARGGLFAVSQQASSIATVLLFGAGTDYTIFIVSRYREELRHTEDKHLAMQTTMRAVGEAITSSAGTVILALLTLLLATIGLYSSLGPTLAISIAVMLAAGLTLVPALLTWLGRAAYWPFIPRYQPMPADAAPPTLAAVRTLGFWGRLGVWTARHRVVALVGSVALLGVLALGNLGVARSYNFLTSFRATTDATTGFAVLQRHFPAGSLAPTTVVIQLHGADPNVYHHLAEIDAVTATLARQAHVAEAQGPTRPLGQAPAVSPQALQAQIAALPDAIKQAIRSGQTPQPGGAPGAAPNPQLLAAIGAYAASVQYVSADSSTAQLSVAFDDDPYALPAINRIDALRAAVNQALAAHGLGAGAATSATASLAGQTAQLTDTQADDVRDTRLIVPVTLALVGIVLMLLLRSLIAPLYLLAAVTLNFFAAIGVCSFFFQRVQGQDGIYYAIPLYTFIFLVALGADYTIFLMSRVREEAQRSGLELGMPVAVAHTGGVITSAGLILAGTFAVLTTTPLTLLYQFGICVAVGVLLDTFVVRGLLIPSLALLLGRWNWWPGALKTPGAADEESQRTALP